MSLLQMRVSDAGREGSCRVGSGRRQKAAKERTREWCATVPTLGEPRQVGMVSVLRNGKRFVDAAPEVGKPAGAFIFCDPHVFSRFGLDHAKPLPLRNLIEAGYLIKADSIRDLATKGGIPDVLEMTIKNYKVHAKNGEDPEFEHASGVDSQGPNLNVASLTKPPFYAVWMRPRDIGNFTSMLTCSVGTGR